MRNRYDDVLVGAWKELRAWMHAGKIQPTCEEDVQCFLYYSMVKKLGDALYVKPKPGRAGSKGHHFPDFILGENGGVVVEIKFSYYTRERSGSKQAGIGACLTDVEKMAKHFPNSRRYFLLVETSNDGRRESNLNSAYLEELKKADPMCNILYYPEKLNETLNPAQRAWMTRRYGKDRS